MVSIVYIPVVNAEIFVRIRSDIVVRRISYKVAVSTRLFGNERFMVVNVEIEIADIRVDSPYTARLLFVAYFVSAVINVDVYVILIVPIHLRLVAGCRITVVTRRRKYGVDCYGEKLCPGFNKSAALSVGSITLCV